MTEEAKQELAKAAAERRVIVTRTMLNPGRYGLMAICFMQVCAVADATDEEILLTCNTENNNGTLSHPWSAVHRECDRERGIDGAGPCEEIPGRLHFLVSC